MLAKNSIVSPTEYQASSVIAQEAADDMFAQLDWLTIKPQKIVDVGAGTSELSRRLVARYPDALVYACDSADDLLKQIKAQAPSVQCVTVPDITLPFESHSVDLLFANLYLPWQTQIAAHLNEWRRVLRIEGVLLLSVFGLNTLLEWQSILPMDLTPTRVDMHDVGDALTQAGFVDPVLQVSHYELSYRDLSTLKRELLHTGMWFGESADLHALRVEAEDARWPLTYEVIHAHAFKGAPKQKDSSIPLATLRQQLPSQSRT